MNMQDVYSLAIQALFERRNRLMQAGRYPDAVKHCEEAIRELEKSRDVDLFLDELNKTTDCDFNLEIRKPCDGE